MKTKNMGKRMEKENTDVRYIKKALRNVSKNIV